MRNETAYLWCGLRFCRFSEFCTFSEKRKDLKSTAKAPEVTFYQDQATILNPVFITSDLLVTEQQFCHHCVHLVKSGRMKPKMTLKGQVQNFTQGQSGSWYICDLE